MAIGQENYMFEHYRQPLITWEAFLLRMLRHLGLASVMMAMSLGIGVIGYRNLGELSWVDALLNASMILGGMGPVDTLPNVILRAFCRHDISGGSQCADCARCPPRFTPPAFGFRIEKQLTHYKNVKQYIKKLRSFKNCYDIESDVRLLPFEEPGSQQHTHY
jgi:hypothetical protein